MPRTYSDIYIDVRKKLREKGVEAYQLEARLLVSHAAGKSVDELLRELPLYASDQVEERVAALTERRMQDEPVAYLLGEWEFYGLPIVVTKDVLIPRPDTEILVETAVKALHGRKMDARVLDLCTGSGCIGCAIASELPASHVVLVDNSAKALTVAKQNILKNRLNPRVTCVETDALLPPPPVLGSFDLLCCNPPYIASDEIATLDASVRDFEPLAALDGGADGLVFYRSIIPKWKNVVRAGGLMIFEVGEGQSGDVMELMKKNGLTNVGSVKDTNGTERVVCGNV
ncbi:MAG: peptide chain release factor N(5)-glutamine methyltransferase [Oscillospiraceae bacterium]|jgi:release factor glutamine methyltransferase